MQGSPTYQDLLDDVPNLYPTLRRLDEELAAAAKKLGCPCGGTLHRADYPRKPRPPGVSWHRISFCCAKEGCRRRTTPASVLFLGRKVYPAAIVVLVSILRLGPTPARFSKLEELVGVSQRTVRRWRKWWLKNFVESNFWTAARGLMRAPLDESQLPLTLLEAFGAEPGPLKLVQLLRFIGPLTTRSVHLI